MKSFIKYISNLILKKPADHSSLRQGFGGQARVKQNYKPADHPECRALRGVSRDNELWRNRFLLKASLANRSRSLDTPMLRQRLRRALGMIRRCVACFLLGVPLAKLGMIFAVLFSQALQAYSPTNFYRPHDVDFRSQEWKKNNCLRFGDMAEYGETSKCRNWDSDKVHVLKIYNEYQSSVAMLLGAPSGSAAENLANSFSVPYATITDDGYRGAFRLNGEYKELSFIAFAKWKLPLNFVDGVSELNIFVPFKNMEFDNVVWNDSTRDVTSADLEFKARVSSQLAAQARTLGNLDINPNGWSKTGIGDAVVAFKWYKDFKQEKEYLKNVRINLRAGLSIPTAEARNQDEALALPLGNDGAWGIPVNVGLDLDFISNIRTGIEMDFLGLFDSSGTYRMKTSRYQTDFLLLNKGRATKTQGATWRFNLFGQAKNIFNFASAMINYEFFKKDEDRLHPKTYEFDYSIVNSAESLKERNFHNFVFRLAINPLGIKSRFRFDPQFSFFYKYPFAGKRTIVSETFGAQLAFNF